MEVSWIAAIEEDMTVLISWMGMSPTRLDVMIWTWATAGSSHCW